MRGPFQEPDPRSPFWPTRAVQIGGPISLAYGAAKLANRLWAPYVFGRKNAQKILQKEIALPTPKKSFYSPRPPRRNSQRRYQKNNRLFSSRRQRPFRRRYNSYRHSLYAVHKSRPRHRRYKLQRPFYKPFRSSNKRSRFYRRRR